MLLGYFCLCFFSWKRAWEVQDRSPGAPQPRQLQLCLRPGRTGPMTGVSSRDRGSARSSQQRGQQSPESSTAALTLRLVISLGVLFCFFLFRGVHVTTSSERVCLLQTTEKVPIRQPQPPVPSLSSVASTPLQSRSRSSRYLTPR